MTPSKGDFIDFLNINQQESQALKENVKVSCRVEKQPLFEYLWFGITQIIIFI